MASLSPVKGVAKAGIYLRLPYFRFRLDELGSCSIKYQDTRYCVPLR